MKLHTGSAAIISRLNEIRRPHCQINYCIRRCIQKTKWGHRRVTSLLEPLDLYEGTMIRKYLTNNIGSEARRLGCNTASCENPISINIDCNSEHVRLMVWYSYGILMVRYSYGNLMVGIVMVRYSYGIIMVR
jgi:hypothetical protein